MTTYKQTPSRPLPGTLLITGVSGFIGKRLAARVSGLGTRTIGIMRDACELPVGVVPIRGDIARSNVLNHIDEPIDSVMHLAGQIYNCTDSSCVTDNVYGTYAMLEWARRNNVRKLIYASTMGVTTPRTNDESMNESAAVKPDSLYALTKYLGEQVLTSGVLPHVILRSTFVYGPGDKKGFIGRLHMAAQTSSRVEIRDEARDFLHVDDLVDALIRSVTYDGPISSIFCLGSGKRVALREIAQEIAQKSGSQLKTVDKPGRTQGRVDWSLAKSELNWRPDRSLQTIEIGSWC